MIRVAPVEIDGKPAFGVERPHVMDAVEYFGAEDVDVGVR